MESSNTLIDLSRAEYDILRVLWKSGRLSVREVHQHLSATYDWAYTTTKTMMDRLVAKNLLARENFHGVFLYTPLISRPAGLARMVQFFADRVLEMDVGSVVSLFARSKALTPEEIEELHALVLQNADEGKK
ncbi:MAG: BlaI/MecI/CopY family transcriptional regulator [Candidatus Zhuqueibacterota bacterium]